MSPRFGFHVKKKIAVLGSGANGSSIGADLTQAGLDVTLVEQWPEHVEKIRRDGLTIEMDDTTVFTRPSTLHLCELATVREKFDIVLVLMKAYDTTWACQLIKPYLAADGIVAGVQNGMTTDSIAAVVGESRTVGAVIEISSTMDEPGLVHRHANRARSWFAVQDSETRLPADSTTVSPSKEDLVAQLLEHSGTVERVQQIAPTKWMKLVSNSTVLVPTAIAGVPMFEAFEIPGLRNIMIRAGQEALAVGQAQGLPVLPIFGLETEDLARIETAVTILLDRLYERFVVPGATTTVLQDWTKGRRSEVDSINGAVVSGGRETRTRTPVNNAIVDIAHIIESGSLRPGLDAVSQLRRLIETYVAAYSH